MPAKDLGLKHLCFKCATKFYDLKKPDPLCPKCGADQRESPANKPSPEGRRGRLAAVQKIVEPIPEVAATDEVEPTEEEDVDGLEDDDDDLPTDEDV